MANYPLEPTSRRTFLFDWARNQQAPAESPTSAHHLPIQIAGVSLLVATHSDRLEKELRQFFNPYLAPGRAEVRLHAELFSSPEIPDLWEDVDAEFECRTDTVVQRDFAARRLNEDMVVARLNPEEVLDAFLNLLRWMLPDLLLEKSAFLLHAASVVRNEKGFVFFGQSGAGKSTTVKLIAAQDSETTILGDDAAIIELDADGRPWLHSAPLGSAHAKVPPLPAKVRLTGLFSLRQSSEHRLETLTASEALSALLASAMSVDFSRNVDRRFQLASDFARALSGPWRLHFKRDGDFWPKVRAVVPD